MQAAKKFGKLSKLVESQSSGMEQVKKESARHSFRQLVDQCVPYPNNPMQGVERQHIIQCNPHATCVHHMLLNSFFIYMFRPQPFQKKKEFSKKKEKQSSDAMHHTTHFRTIYEMQSGPQIQIAQVANL